MASKRDKVRTLSEHTFTGRAEELALFRSLLPRERTRAVDILVLHGIGGMGKSRLLDQYQQIAASEHIPTARIDPQVQATVYSFLTTIHQQLARHVAFPQFEKGLKHHDEIEMKLVGHGDIPRPVLRLFVKGTRVLLDTLPGTSALNELMSAEEMEAHIGKIYSIVGRKDGDFWMKPDEDLTDFLVADINEYCTDHRLVLMADTYELMGTFDGWLRDRVFANLGEYGILVIAGRNKLEGKGWQEFASLMHQHELPPFTASDSDTYLQRKGITDADLIVEMSDYAGGHPLTLALLADLAGQLKAGDLARAPERRDIIRTLLERITQNITTTLRDALEVCAVLRVVNQDSLAWMLTTPTPRPTDDYTPYETGMHTLLAQIGRDHPRYNDALVYEQRLRENISQTRRYGDDPTQENDRAEVLDQINRLAYDISGVSFNELCRRHTPPPAPSAPTHLDRSRIQTMFDDLRRFDFVKVRSDGLALHDTVWEAMNEELRWRSPAHYREMNAKAASYYEHMLAQPNVQERDWLTFERLYHRIREDETNGIRLFQEMAEEFSRHRMVDKLRVLLNEVHEYPLEQENSRLWREYYGARLLHLELQLDKVTSIYQKIGINDQAETKLQAYALCNLGDILSTSEWMADSENARDAYLYAQRSLKIVPELDAFLITNYATLSSIHKRQGKWELAIKYLNEMMQYSQNSGNSYLVAHTFLMSQILYFQQGNWREGLNAHLGGLKSLPKRDDLSGVKAQLLGRWMENLVHAGRYSKAEQNLLKALYIADKTGEVDVARFLRDKGFAIGMQKRYIEAEDCLHRAQEIGQRLGKARVLGQTAVRGFWGLISLRQGKMDEAEKHFVHVIEIRQNYRNTYGEPEFLPYLAHLAEVQHNWQDATEHYQRTLALNTGRLYFENAARTGLVRVHHATGNYAAIPALLAEAEALAQQYEYNDHLASLRLSQGHIAWDGLVPEFGSGFDAALGYYQQALIYALRYNRFLLDEVLWGGNITTPLHPIIPHCQQRGEEGQRMLAALRDWWKTATNDTGMPRAETISLVPEGVPLLEAERIARANEPGDGSPQVGVVEVLDR